MSGEEDRGDAVAFPQTLRGGNAIQLPLQLDIQQNQIGCFSGTKEQSFFATGNRRNDEISGVIKGLP